MGLNPMTNEERCERILRDKFNGGSPYYDMFTCGWYEVPLEMCIRKCAANGISLRKKDIENYNNGLFQHGAGIIIKNGQAVNIADISPGVQFEDIRFEDFPKFPVGWVGSERRFFPCSKDNKPMQPWGWKKNEDGSVFTPELHTKADAKALSPCGWVGQNMLYQKFVVMDIDGRGHGSDDLEVIAFGDQFKDKTYTMEDPLKPGSFHLYFKTDRIIPVKHFTWAKLDFMGNAVNAAVYLKNKKWNGMKMLELNEDIWNAMIKYQRGRR